MQSKNERVRTTKQIDLILYNNSYPILFREGDFVILTPDPVMGIIEVKTKIKKAGENSLERILIKSYENAKRILKSRQNPPISQHFHFFNGIFSYDSEVGYRAALNAYQRHLPYNDDDLVHEKHEKSDYIVNNLCLNQNIFMRVTFHGFAAYKLQKLAPSYFISNLLSYLKNRELGDQRLWFALPDKAPHELDSVNI